MRRTAYTLFLVVVIGVGLGRHAALAAGPAVEFLEEVFRQEDARRKRQQEKLARPAHPPVARPARPAADISDVTYAAPEQPKNADAATILVVGDEMAGGIAEELRQTYAEDRSVKITPVTRQGVGIISGASTDWGALVREAMAEKAPAAIIVMFGFNDRQALIDGERIVEFRDPRWRDIYQARIDQFLGYFGALRTRLYWTGLPIMRAARDSEDSSFFDEIFKSRMFTASARFVDVWEGFADDEGKYVAIGPDINGNKRRLRKSDGINVTPAGNRKLAFFVDNTLKRDGAVSAAPLIAGLELPSRRDEQGTNRLPGSVAPSVPAAPIAALAPNYVGAVVQLTPLPFKPGAELATSPVNRDDFASRVLQRGDLAPTHVGRADHAQWPSPAAVVSRPPVGDEGRTLALRPTP